MINRVQGVATAWRYANTELYGYGKQTKPKDMSYKEFAEVIMDSYDSVDIVSVKRNINSIIRRHYAKTDDKIPDEEHHVLTGTSWQFICKLITKGDFKGRTAPKLESKAIAAQKKLGINSFESAVLKYGSEKYKQKRLKNKQ
jgi:predicted phosphoadenosine phosphosulfate sulfurtransferase